MTISSCTPCIDGDTSDTENASFCCLSSFRNRLFCSCTLATHPADCQKQVNSDHPNNLDNKVKVSVSPGIVARLMGLESMPEPNWVPKERNLDSVRRSRSVNSIDYWSGFDPIQGFHRRVRTSLSFHDMPRFLQVNNNEFLLVRSEERKPEMSSKEVKQREMEITKKKSNRREGVAQKKEKRVCSKVVHKSVTTARPTRNAATSRKINHSCAGPSQRKNDSKKSVRVHDRKKPKLQLPVKEISRRRISNSRKKQQKNFLNSNFSSTHSIHTMNSANQGQTKKAGVCKLAEEDVESLNWNLREMWKLVHIEEIGIEFGLRILDRLVHEFVAELSGLPMENLGLLLMEDAL